MTREELIKFVLAIQDESRWELGSWEGHCSNCKEFEWAKAEDVADWYLQREAAHEEQD